jgi:hypothetical protein
VAKGNPRGPRGVAASDSLPLFPPDVSDKPVSRRNDRAATPNVVATSRKADPTPEDLERKAMTHQPRGASSKKVKLSLTVFLSREQAERLTARAIRQSLNAGRSAASSADSRRDGGWCCASPGDGGLE